MFKRLIAKDHPDFSKTKQQDAAEFFHYFLTQIQKHEKIHNLDPTAPFTFKQEEKLQCLACKGVRYTVANNMELSLPIPLGQPTITVDEKKTETKTYPPVPFIACVKEWSIPAIMEDYRCPSCNSKQKASKQSRIHTFPDILFVQMKRFTLDGWVPVKLDVEVDTPAEIDLDEFRAKGLQEGEKELPKDSNNNSSATNKPQPDESLVLQLESMGFSRNACIIAVLAVNNSNIDAASNWLFSHLEDPDINDPIPEEKPTTATSSSSDTPSPDLIEGLAAMGFDRARCIYALKQCSNSVERAADWLFSHEGDIIPTESEQKTNNTNTSSAIIPIDTKPARYRLCAYITHIGKSTGSGHYVCCILREGKWVLYNDHKVSLASATMKKTNPELAYLYFWRRIPA